MKGIILAGDSGDNLKPLTLGIPKQLIPIYDKPMIYYPIMTLANAGINEFLIITTEESQELFRKALQDGTDFGVKFDYAIQNEPNGIAEAILIGKDFIESDGFCLATGDLIIDGDTLSDEIKKGIRSVVKSGNATIFIEDKTYPNQYGKVIIDMNEKEITILSDEDLNHYYSIASLFIFPNNAIKLVDKLTISKRGRLEINDLNKLFLRDCKLQVKILDRKNRWFDTNTFDNILRCSMHMYNKAINKNLL